MFNSNLSRSLLCSLVAFTCIENLAATPRTMSVDVRHSEGGGVGYSQSYSSLDGFFALDKETYIPYIDARGHVFNDGRFAANVGVGARGVYDSSCLAIGGNVFYDYRDTHRKSYNQIGLGFEVLKPLWEIHVNGYFPVGSKKSQFFDKRVKNVSLGGAGASGGATGTPTFDHFAGHNLFLSIPGMSSSSFVRIKKKKQEFAMAGVDADFNVHLVKAANINFEAGAGPYYYRGSYGKQAIGGKAKVTAKWSRYVAGEFAASYDNIFHGRIHGGLSLIYPFGPKLKKREPNNTCTSHPDLFYDRLVQRADRAEIIVVDRKHFTSKQTIVIPGTATVIAVAINPATGLPWNFVFVNNESSSDGTFESPYPSLALAENNSAPNDVIYVYPGDRTTRNYNTGFSMQDVQKLWGAGIAHDLPTTVGTVVVPALAASNPNIGNGDMTNVFFFKEAVRLSNNNNEVAGVNFIDEVGGSMVHVLSGVEITNALIQNNTFQLINDDTGLYIDNSTFLGHNLGQIDFINNDIQVVDVVTNGVNAVQVLSGDGGVVNITGNALTTPMGFFNRGFDIIVAQGYNLVANINNNSLTDLDTGMRLLVAGNSSTLTANISNNTLDDFNIGIDASSEDTSTLTTKITGNQLTNFNIGISAESADTSTLTANITGNKFTNFGTGISANSASTSTLTANITGNQFTDFNTGISAVSEDTSTFTANITGNQLADFNTGISAESFNSSILTQSIQDNIFDETLFPANNYSVFAQSHDTSINNPTFLDNTVTDGSGFGLTSLDSSSMTAIVSGNTFTNPNNNHGALATFCKNNSTQNLDVNTNIVNGGTPGSSADGMFSETFQSSGSGTPTLTASYIDNVFNNVDYAFQIRNGTNVADTATTVALLCGNTMSINPGGDGLDGDQTSTGTFCLGAFNNTQTPSAGVTGYRFSANTPGFMLDPAAGASFDAANDFTSTTNVYFPNQAAFTNGVCGVCPPP